MNKRALVIGGGIFGVTAAIELAKSGIDTYLFERGAKLMHGATSVNQNRFHLGYHYPRSAATAKQCLEGLASFKEYFAPSLVDVKENYYAIGKDGSRVSFEEYIDFCDELQLSYEEKFPSERLLNRAGVSGCISVKEQIINLDILKSIAENLLRENGVRIRLDKEYIKGDEKNYDIVVNATYSNLNSVNKMLGLVTKEYRYDICNVPVLKLPKDLSGIGITIMDGDFYSILPYAGTPYHLFWSVRGSATRYVSKSPPKRYPLKVADYNNGRYIPLLRNAKLVDVLRVTKILRPDVELSDERISDLVDYGYGRFAILSAKLNTCVLTARKIVESIKNL